MAYQRITNPTLAPSARTALLNEYIAAGLDPLLVPTEGSIAAVISDPNCFVLRDTTEPRIVVLMHKEGSMWWIDQVFGPSALHLKILLRLCNFAVAQGLGSQSVSYRRNNMPIVLLADQNAVTPANFSADGKSATTTFSAAQTTLVSKGVTP